MAWRALALSDIQTGLSKQELIGVQTYALDNGQPDPVPGVIAETMDEVRGYMAASTPTVLGADGTIPSGLIAVAIDIAVWRLVTRFPTKQLSTPPREKRFGDAMSKLKDVARGLFKFEIPTEFTNEVTAGVQLPEISQRGVRSRVRCEEDGI